MNSFSMEVSEKCEKLKTQRKDRIKLISIKDKFGGGKTESIPVQVVKNIIEKMRTVYNQGNAFGQQNSSCDLLGQTTLFELKKKCDNSDHYFFSPFTPEQKDKKEWKPKHLLYKYGLVSGKKKNYQPKRYVAGCIDFVICSSSKCYSDQAMTFNFDMSSISGFKKIKAIANFSDSEEYQYSD